MCLREQPLGKPGPGTRRRVSLNSYIIKGHSPESEWIKEPGLSTVYCRWDVVGMFKTRAQTGKSMRFAAATCWRKKNTRKTWLGIGRVVVRDQ
jgi:hypothetical protein